MSPRVLWLSAAAVTASSLFIACGADGDPASTTSPPGSGASSGGGAGGGPASTGASTASTGGAGGAPIVDHAVSVEVVGLVGRLVLQNAGGDDLTIDADGTYTFSERVVADYAVAIASEPGLQRCTVVDGAGTASADVTVPVACEDQLLFPATDGSTGFEPYKTDGTAAGTTLVADIHPTGDGGTEIGTGARLGDGRYVFVADDGTHGREPWITDGTPSGTTLLRDIAPNGASSAPATFLAYDGSVYFVAEGDGDGREIWVTDGTQNGTVKAIELIQGPNGSDPSLLGAASMGIWFSARRTASGPFTLHFSDGTIAGTEELDPTTVATFGAAVLDDVLFYRTFEQADPLQLWTSDGTASGTQLLIDPNPNGPFNEVTRVTAVNGRVFFTAASGVDDVEPWVSDGTAPGTTRLGDLSPENNYARGFAPCLGQTFFRARDGATLAVFASDGTPGGTTALFTVDDASGFIDFDGRCAFAGVTPEEGRELSFTGGTPGDRTSIEIAPGPADGLRGILGVVGGKVVFRGDDDLGVAGEELWVSDGTPAGTELLLDLCPGSCSGTGPPD